MVEVTTSRARNLAQHKELQRRVAEAVDAALALEKRFEKEAEAEAEEADPTGTAHPRAVVSSTVSRFALPMLREPTTFVDSMIDPEDPEETKRARAGTTRVGYILEVRLANGAVGRGEASPLPGLHRESAAEAGSQPRRRRRAGVGGRARDASAARGRGHRLAMRNRGYSGRRRLTPVGALRARVRRAQRARRGGRRAFGDEGEDTNRKSIRARRRDAVRRGARFAVGRLKFGFKSKTTLRSRSTR